MTVTGEAPIVESTKSEVSTVITQEQISTLPTQDRVALSLSLLLPGTSVDTTRARESRRIDSSTMRPTSGMVRRDDRGLSSSTGNTRSSSLNCGTLSTTVQ